MFLLQGIGMGVGVGLVFVPSSTIALAYFRRWRGLALGVVMSGTAFGGMIFPPSWVSSWMYSKTWLTFCSSSQVILLNLVSLSKTYHFRRSLIHHRGLGDAVRVTSYIILAALIFAIGLFIIPLRTDRDKLPLPELHLLHYSSDIGYISAGFGLVWDDYHILSKCLISIILVPASLCWSSFSHVSLLLSS